MLTSANANLFNAIVDRLFEKYPLWACQSCKRGRGVYIDRNCPVHGVNGYIDKVAERYAGLIRFREKYNAFLIELEKSARDRLLSQDRFTIADCPLCNFRSNVITLYCGIHGYNGLVSRIAARYAGIFGPALFRQKVLGDGQ